MVTDGLHGIICPGESVITSNISMNANLFIKLLSGRPLVRGQLFRVDGLLGAIDFGELVIILNISMKANLYLK